MPVDIINSNGDYSIVMTQGTPDVGKPFDNNMTERIAKALGITVSDLRSDCPIAISSAGHSKVMVGIKSNEQLHKLTPDMTALAKISGEIGCNGYYVFTLNPEEKILVHGRMFAPVIGITEDPVTGNANGPLGLYLVHYGLCQNKATDKNFDFDIMQGEAIKRDGTMHVHVDKENGEPTLVKITGDAVVANSLPKLSFDRLKYI